MSPLKRTQRASAKQAAGRGRHAKPQEPRRTVADVPVELRPSDYGFPKVQLPEDRPHVTSVELLGALNGDDTQPLAPVAEPEARIVDSTPQPVRIEGLTPASAPSIPLPSLPFLNAGAHVEPRPSPRAQVIVREGSALPPRLTGAELMILGQPVPNDAPPAPRPRAVFHTFDRAFWTRLHQHTNRAHAVAESLTAANDRQQTDLSERLARLESRHRDAMAQHHARPLPRRIPGAALAAIETGELVSA